jgi:hypothetical protein
MSKYQFDIKFDKADPTYRFGELITGRVLLEAENKLDLHGIKLEYGWRTHGKGNVDKGDIEKLDLNQGEIHLAAGEQEEIPFEFIAPNGPVSYHGKNLNVDWYITAHLIFPWRDSRQEQDFLLIGSGSPEMINLGKRTILQADLPPRTSLRQPISKTVAAAIPDERAQKIFSPNYKFALITALVLGAVSMLYFVHETVWELIPVFIIFVLSFLIFSSIYQPISSLLSKRKFSIDEFMVEPKILYQGETVTCHLQLRMKSTVYVEQIAAMISADEKTTKGGGTQSTSYEHNAYLQSFVKQYSDRFEAGRWIDFECDLPTTLDAPATFGSNNSSVSWTVKVKVIFKRWLAWQKDVQITVLPAPTSPL